MKGRLYRPEKKQYDNSSRWKSNEETKANTQPIHYIWLSSIPETWKKIMTKKKIPMLQANQHNRNTLEFLKETQKYINQICKPSDFEMKYQVPVILSSPERIKLSRTQYNSPVPVYPLSSKDTVGLSQIEEHEAMLFPKFKQNSLIKLKKRINKKRHHGKLNLAKIENKTTSQELFKKNKRIIKDEFFHYE